MTTPIDFAALAREWLTQAAQRGSYLPSNLGTFIEDIATQSHAAGRAEGLEAAAAHVDTYFVYRRIAAEIRALASSDPAPRDQVEK